MAGLAFRLIIAYLLPGSGFQTDISAFQYWAGNLASQGFAGWYDRPFFHDYTPGYLYVLWLVGELAQLLGTAVGDLIKLPPALADVALGYVVWSMARDLGASQRAARIAAILVIFNPVSWFDSVVWGQVDSVGTVVLLLAVRELWRDRPERSAVLATLAAIIKPQLGILIPIVAVVVIRRALRPDGAFGDETAPVDGATAWERNVRGPIRIVTTALAGLATAILVSLPFGLSFPGLIEQVFKTAAGYPYLSVNAFNPWALVAQDGNGVAANGLWVCDSTITPSGPFQIGVGPFVLYTSQGSSAVCANGFLVGAVPAVLVGILLFLVVAGVVLALVARRPDRRTILVGLVVLAIAFFVLPTRVHERYLYPLIALGAILAGASLRWRAAYVLASLAMLGNMYGILIGRQYATPNITDWLGIAPALVSYAGVATIALVVLGVFLWSFIQLRDDALDHLAEELRGPGEASGSDAGASSGGWSRPAAALRPAYAMAAAGGADATGPAANGMALGIAGPALASTPPADAGVALRTMPAWDERVGTADGIFGWFRERFWASPIRPDRSRGLDGEGGGRLDRLDIWMLAVLVVSLLTVRMWRLSEPYGMHFDEVYHARTATEFLQDWRYGISHDIYEWTHPHLAKYAMAIGIEFWGDDRTDATSDLGVPVASAAIEPRWDAGDEHHVLGDRLWVATGSELRAYDLSTRALVGTIAIPGADAVAVDALNHRLFVGTTSGAISTVDTTPLDEARRAGTTGSPEADAFMTVDGPVSQLHVIDDGSTLVAVIPAAGTQSKVETIDTGAISVLGTASLAGVTQLANAGDSHVAVATSSGVAFVDVATGNVSATVALEGPAKGVTATTDLTDNPLYVSVQSPSGPVIDTITGTGTSDSIPTKVASFPMPGATAGLAFYDSGSRMVHILGSVADDPSETPTVYVIEPHANDVYADAPLPSAPAAIVMDDQPNYPSDDRQQLLSFSSTGQVASVEIGDHALAWRIPGVLAGVAMGALIYVLSRLLFKRRWIAVAAAFLTLADGMLFAQSRIGMNDTYVGLGIVAAYTLFAALWLRPGDTRRHWIAFWVGMPILGVVLGLALASKWVAAYAMGGLAILVLSRSALGRLILIVGMIFLTTVLGYIAISVPPDSNGGENYLFLFLMVGLTIVSVIASILHPVAWTWEEERFAIGVPIVGGLAVLALGFIRGDPAAALKVGPISASPLELAFVAFVGAGLVYVAFLLVGQLGFGPRAVAPGPEDPAAVLDPPTPAPRGWLRLGSAYGLAALWTVLGIVVIPVVVYVISYIPWAMVENHQLWADMTILGIHISAWPPGHTGQTLIQLTGDMYRYHNTLTQAHPADSPWWAWPLDFKPVWFYEGSFTGGTSASIYDAGNLVLWWLSIPAMAFVAFQAFKRRSAALALLAIGFACQWISWSRIDRAAFQYHYYTSVPFLVIALGYFLAELWHGASRHTWLLARVSAGVAVLAPFGLWLLHRPLCGFVDVTSVNPGSQACPTYIPDLTLSPRAIAIAAVVGIGVLLLVRALLAYDDDPGRGGVMRKLRSSALIAVGVVVALFLASNLFKDNALITLGSVPVEPIALVVTLALLPVAAIVATARDTRRFVAGAFAVIGFWFVLWYPNVSALPLPSAIHNAYQGFLPTYVYPFQFPVSKVDRSGPGANLFDLRVAALLGALVLVSIVVAYSAWTWRIALAERRREEAGWGAREVGAG